MNTTKTLTAAIAAAMNDYLENDGSFATMNPSIVLDETGYSYGSDLNNRDAICISIQDGFGSWTPEVADEVDACAAGFAQDLEEAFVDASNQQALDPAPF